MTGVSINSASFRDSAGFVFTRQDRILRQVNTSFAASFDKVKDSGLFEHLWRENLLVRHEEVDEAFEVPETGARVLLPERVPFISYPYEWCFSALRDAALATLKIQQLCLERGFTLRDASAYNIQFLRGNPVLIDTLSIEPCCDGSPWNAYRQFCRHFLAPLALMAYCDARTVRLLAEFIDGVPLDMAAALLPGRSYLNSGVAMHIHMHAKARPLAAPETGPARRAAVSRESLLGLIASLSATVSSLHYKPGETQWGDYYANTNYSDEAFAQKKKIVDDVLRAEKPKVVWDLGANDGAFSRIAANHSELVISLDVDPKAVDANYREMRQNARRNLLPLLCDLTNPSAGIGWANQERQSLSSRGPADALMALALIHHLCIANNIPLRMAARYFASLADFAIVEFVPKSDSQVKSMLATREDIFEEYDRSHFEEAFGCYFAIEGVCPVTGSERTVYILRRKACAH